MSAKASKAASAAATGSSAAAMALGAPAQAAQVMHDLAVDMPSPASTMGGALPLVATLLFLVVPVTFLLIIYIKDSGELMSEKVRARAPPMVPPPAGLPAETPRSRRDRLTPPPPSAHAGLPRQRPGGVRRRQEGRQDLVGVWRVILSICPVGDAPSS